MEKRCCASRAVKGAREEDRLCLGGDRSRGAFLEEGAYEPGFGGCVGFAIAGG